MVLAQINLTIELREIILKNRPKELYMVSSKGTVPVLVTANDTVIDESLDIMLWALKEDSKQNKLLNDLDKAMKIIEINDTIFKKWLDKYKYHDRYKENSKEFYRHKCTEILNNYDKNLDKTKYIISDELNIVDIAIFPFIRQFANVDISWFSNTYKNLPNWLYMMCKSTLFNSVMKKYNIWEAGNQLIVNFND